MNDRRRHLVRTIGAWAFPLALWLIATAWFGFDIGKYSDDWAISLRTPETDAYQWPASPYIRWHYFWRPAHLLTVYALATAFWHHDWVNHAISALAHLGVGLLLYRFLRAVGIGSAPARCAMCLFLVVPVSAEAVLWPAALGSVVGVGWFLLIALMCVRWAREGEKGRGGGREWIGLVGMGVMGLLTACWHEQPAACVLALPALFVALRGCGEWGTTMRRALAATGACAMGVAAYIVLFMATVPPGRRGGTNTLVGVDAIGNRLWRLGEMAWNLSLGPRGRDTTRDAWALGGRVIRESPGGVGWAVIACMIGLGVWWVGVLVRGRSASARDGRDERSVRLARGPLALFGLGIAISSVLPIAIVAAQPMQARYLYGAGLGVAIALAAGMDVLLMGRRRSRVEAGLAATGLSAIVAVALCGAVCCMGWQTQFRRRSIADVDQMAQLRRLVPNPPKSAVFVPLELADGRAPYLRPHNPGVLGALTAPWSCWAYVQGGYGRSDITATHLRPGHRPPLNAGGAGIRYSRGLSDAWGVADPANALATWEKAILFAVDREGVVRLVSREEAMQWLGGAPAPQE